jgi:protein neuralized
MTDKAGSWAKALSEKFATPDSILSFYFTSDGNIHYAINGEDKGYFSLGLQGNNLWALIDIYGNTSGIQIIDPRLQLQSTMKNQSIPRRSQSMAVIKASSGDDDDSLYESMAGLSIVDHDQKREPLPQVYSKVNLRPLSFHRTRGCNVRLSNDR